MYINNFDVKKNQLELTTLPGEAGFTIYRSFVESIQDYKRWQDTNYRGGNYFVFLQEIGYAEDPSYITKLKEI
jgi:flagellum-specific peptidoglycan hydrolase FlgJ